MIQVNATPAFNRLILDGNSTVISITSNHGAGYYFRAKIYIDDEFFDTQSWSRKDAYTAEKDLKYLYNAYFETVFNETFTPGVTEQTHLIKKVSIIIQELLMSDDSVVSTRVLPDFYIMYNNKAVPFSDTEKVKLLGMDAEKMLLPVNGKISVPVYTNTDAETVVFTLKDNFNTVIDTQTVASSTAKKVHLYNFDLSDHTFATNTIYFILSVTVGSTTTTQAFRYLQFPDFQVKEIAFLNNFGFYVYAYLDGQMNIDKAVSIESSEQNNGSEKIIEIDEQHTYSINSGSLLDSEKELITMIINSLSTKLYWKQSWIEMVTQTKKSKVFQDRLNNYSENLIFTVKTTNDEANTGMESIYESEEPISESPSEEPSASRITLLSTSTGGGCVTVYFTLEAGYEPSGIIMQIINNETDELYINPGGTTSPRTRCSLPAGSYTVWLKEVETGLFSNPLTFTIS